ncbi:SGNH/GDSL hydrolase family protein [Pseudomaricurvus sp. HS19]|uniref:SGNH/GDSL hydrolase family protein n=1 Tax=Pseudomaricurvus sp. HS19 TaxID=2692626 RepID=UPI00136FC2C3|nr:SGNH/GDSL hydrolase family protein [Pseudomaricurvus sp. HS19]MYM64209.1 hypothetical protein [Pseudomaricurvus sp. HS19]
MIKKLKQTLRRFAVPEDSPRAFLARGREPQIKRLVVCAGDSITHGVMGGDYVALLQQALTPDGYGFVNAGINGDLAYNVDRRLDKIIACQPDVVTLLVGTNDVNATLGGKVEALYRDKKQIPVTPTRDWYVEQVRSILQRLQAGGVEHIAVLSLPMLGEDTDSDLNARILQYNVVLRSLCEELGVSYLPLHETLMKLLPAGHRPPRYQGSQAPAFKALARHYLLGQGWDHISRKQGFYLVTDHIHLNDRAAAVIRDLIMNYLRGLE